MTDSIILNQMDIEDLRVDPERIEKELLNQPTIYAKYSQLYAKQLYMVAESKRLLDEKKAELNLEMKRKPENFNIPKTSDPTIDSAVTIHPDVVHLHEQYNRQLSIQKEIEGFIKAFDQRAKLLSDEVKLIAIGFYGTPTTAEYADAASREQHREKVRKTLEDRKNA